MMIQFTFAFNWMSVSEFCKLKKLRIFLVQNFMNIVFFKWYFLGLYLFSILYFPQTTLYTILMYLALYLQIFKYWLSLSLRYLHFQNIRKYFVAYSNRLNDILMSFNWIQIIVSYSRMLQYKSHQFIEATTIKLQ